ncbi:MAG: 30S ribosome-binding factor RbfA [Oscillospiraceae bacterium]|jgi:ribosome-binding factor A|nr:30S ribosome-binding factor RbfA [Oscillospiraceae bacterium]
MPNRALSRTAENIKRELTDILRDIKDYRVAGNIVSVVHVDLSSDFSHARVYIRSLLDEGEEKEMLGGLNNAVGFVRTQLGLRIRLKRVPGIVFVIDKSARYGENINKNLKFIMQRMGANQNGK